MNPFEQKSIFVHNVPAVLGGDCYSIASWLKSHGFKTVMPKMADGWLEFRPSILGKVNVDQTFVDVMHLNDISVIGWGFCYGWNPEGEGKIAAQLCDKYGLDGWIFDVEKSFENYSDCIKRAGKVIGKFRDSIQRRVPLGFCSWAYYWGPTGRQYHKPELAKFMMDFCDYIVPMVYWNKLGGDGKPVSMTDEQVLAYCNGSIEQQCKITTKPIIPALRAYTGDGGFIDAANITATGIWAHNGFPGASWWFLDHAIKNQAAADALGNTPSWENAEQQPARKMYITVDCDAETLTYQKTPTQSNNNKNLLNLIVNLDTCAVETEQIL